MSLDQQLANEIFLDLFEYCSAIDLLRTFHGLNTRFNTLLFNHFRSYHWNLRSISKRHSHTICEKAPPLLVVRTRLRSLPFDPLRSARTISTVIDQCHQLIHLDLTSCFFSNTDPSTSYLFNTIWSLRNLVRCYIDIRFDFGMGTVQPTVISNSLQSLKINSFYYDSEDLARLRFAVYGSSAIMSDLLHKLPNLRDVTSETDDMNWDGHLWHHMITGHLPKLKRFRLSIILRVADDENDKEERVDRLLESFQTPFWLERRWFVRCDWDQCEECDKNALHLYTIPYIGVDDFFHQVSFRTKSTCPDPEKDETFECVRRLEYGLNPSSENLFSSQSRFKNLRHLDVSLPVDATFMSIISQFDQLISLEVALSEDNLRSDNSPELQASLDQASHLYALKFRSWSSTATRMPSFDYLNRSVCRLDVENIDRCYTSEQCVTLVHSPLGLQCQVLCIAVEHRRSILDLIDKMTRIRILNLLCRDDPHKAVRIVNYRQEKMN